MPLTRLAARAVLAARPVRRALAAHRRALPGGAAIAEDIAAALRLGDLAGAARFTRLPVVRARRHIARSIAAAEAPPPREVRGRPVAVPLHGRALAARLYEPRSLAEVSPGLLYLHGGGFSTCDLDTHDTFCRRLARTGRIRVLSLDYRLAPEHRFPAAVDDAVDAFRWLAVHARTLRMDPTRLGVGGDSAGGNLSAVVARHTMHDVVAPRLQLLVYPAVDVRCEKESHGRLGRGWFLSSEMIAWYYQHYLAGDATLARHPDASPLLADEVGRTARALVYTAGFDPLVDEGMAYARRLREAGVEVSEHCFADQIHGFALMTGLCGSARQAAERIARETGDALRAD